MWAGGMATVVEQHPSNSKALNLWHPVPQKNNSMA